MNMLADRELTPKAPTVGASAGINHTGHFTEVRYGRTHLKKSRGSYTDLS